MIGAISDCINIGVVGATKFVDQYAVVTRKMSCVSELDVWLYSDSYDDDIAGNGRAVIQI